MKQKIVVVILFFILPFAVNAFQRDSLAPTISLKALKLNEPIKVDGVLSENVWESNKGVSSFIQRDPYEGAKPTEKTEVLIAYNEDAIYVAAKMYDSSPDSIIKSLSRKDNHSNSDAFTFYVDPYNDKRTGYYFGINAAGTLYDGTLSNDDWMDDSWDGVWEGKTNITDNGWTAELKIPYSQLRFKDNTEQVWGVNFRREIIRKNELDYLVIRPKNGSGFVSRFVELNGIQNIKKPGGVEITPYITTKAEYIQHDENDPFNKGAVYKPSIGADIKYALNSNLILNATINPDFGQVEIDPAQVNLSDYEVYFQEKRPFFIEGSSIFSFGNGGSNNNWNFNWTNPNFFYSRRIGRNPQGSLSDYDYARVPDGTKILGAAKLTGKVFNGWNVGVVSGLTARENAELELDGNRFNQEVEPITYYGVYRAQKDFNEGNQGFGILSTFTNRFFKDESLKDQLNSNAFVYGTDGWTFLDNNKTWVVTGWLAGSHVSGTTQRMIDLQESSIHYFQRPDAKNIKVDSNATSLNGFAGRFMLNKQKGNFYINSAFGFVQPSFDVNDLGFMWRPNALNGHFVAGYKFTEPNKYFRYAQFNHAYFRNHDFDGNKIGEGFFQFAYVQFLNYMSFNWSVRYSPQTVNLYGTRGGPMMINPESHGYDFYFNTDSRKKISAGAGAWRGKGDNYDTYGINTSFEYRPVSNVLLSIEPGFDKDLIHSQWANVDPIVDESATETFGKRYIFATLNQTTLSAGIRMNWTFTPNLSLQLYMQPLISSGKYSDYKELARANSYEFNHFYEDQISYDAENDEYTLNYDKNDPSKSYIFGQPNFNYKSLRGNAVLRWEYKPGSVFYFVWTQRRSDSESIGDFEFKRSVNRLFDTIADNIFMVKFTYWLHK